MHAKLVDDSQDSNQANMSSAATSPMNSEDSNMCQNSNSNSSSCTSSRSDTATNFHEFTIIANSTSSSRGDCPPLQLVREKKTNSHSEGGSSNLFTSLAQCLSETPPNAKRVKIAPIYDDDNDDRNDADVEPGEVSLFNMSVACLNHEPQTPSATDAVAAAAAAPDTPLTMPAQQQQPPLSKFRSAAKVAAAAVVVAPSAANTKTTTLEQAM